MTSLADLVPTLQRLLTTDADRAAAATGFVRRVRVFTGATWVQTLVFGWLDNPDATLSNLCETAAARGVQVSPQAIADRFSPRSVACMETVLTNALRERIVAPATLPAPARFTEIVLVDSTTITLPPALAPRFPGGANQTGGYAALKLGVRFDVTTGVLHLTPPAPAQQHDRTLPVAHVPLLPGSLRLADLGFFDLDALTTLGAHGCYWLTRVQGGTVVSSPHGPRLDLVALLTRRCTHRLTLPVHLGAAVRLPCRLIAERVPAAVAEARRTRLHDEARRRGQPVTAERLALASWTVLVTNAPPALLRVGDALALMRVRWQIELLFKLWKDGNKLDEWRSADPWRILTEVYAKLVVALVQHWLLVATVWDVAERSLVRGAQAVRAHARYLACVFDQRHALRQALAQLTRCVRATARVNKRVTRPSTAQRLAACTVHRLS